MGKNETFHIYVKSEPGYSPKYPAHVIVLLDSVCAVRDLITNCNKSQIATVVSQFVTVAICDGSKYNLSYANEYICRRVDIVKWNTNDTYIEFSSAFS